VIPAAGIGTKADSTALDVSGILQGADLILRVLICDRELRAVDSAEDIRDDNELICDWAEEICDWEEVICD